MSDQEPETETTYFQETEPGAGSLDTAAADHLAMLRVNNFLTTTSADVLHCTACGGGGGSMKRRSPSSSSSLQEQPKSKKITLHPSSSSAAVADQNLRGFTVIPLPITSPINWASPSSKPTPTLRRCHSDPISSPENGKISPASASSPSPAKASSSSSATLPPLPPIFRRSVSDPNPKAYLAAITPPDSINRDSPNSNRMRRMKDRMREMSQWWEEVMREEEEDGGSEVDDKNGNPKDHEAETECEEAVSVERSGKVLIIHIKCPCGKGYQILLSGKNCYYKLM